MGRRETSIVFLILLAVPLGLGLLLVYLAGDLYQGLLEPAEKLKKADMIVILAGGRGRIQAGARLYVKYHEQHGDRLPIYVAGIGAKPDQIFAMIPKDIQEEIRQKDLITERESTNTEGNAQEFLGFARANAIHRVWLVTSGYHIKRAEWIFHGMAEVKDWPLQCLTYPVMVEPFLASTWHKSWTGIRVTLREYLKWLYVSTFWQGGAATTEEDLVSDES